MGMTVTCPQCGHTQAGDNSRGASIGNCPKCSTRMHAWTAGKWRGRYICPVSQRLVTLGLTGAQLSRPMRLALIPEGGTHHGRELGPWERDWLAAAAGKVLGPGCVVTKELDPGRQSPFTPRADLVPAPDGDPATWIVNERLEYRKCAGCGTRFAIVDAASLMDKPWVPGTATWPYPPLIPAGTYACRTCRTGKR